MELLDPSFVRDLIIKKEIIDARSGGLVLGNSHDNNGVNIVMENISGYYLVGELEGFEYVLNEQATVDNSIQLAEINNHSRDFYDNFIEYQLDKSIRIIDARLSTIKSKYILLEGGCSIINKFSTKKYLETLNSINNESLVKKPIGVHISKIGSSVLEKLMMSIK